MTPSSKLLLPIFGFLLGVLAWAADSPSRGPLPKGALERLGSTSWRHGSRILTLALSPEGKLLAAGGGDAPVHLWERATGQLQQTLPEFWAQALAFTADGKYLAAAGVFKTITLWEVETGKKVGELKGHTGPVTALLFTPQGQLLSASLDHTIRLWDWRGQREISRWPGHEGEVRCLALDASGQRLASGGGDFTIRLWALPGGQPLRQWSVPGGVTTLAFVSTGKQLASGGEDGEVRLWDPAQGQEQRRWSVSAMPVRTLLADRQGQLLVGTYEGQVTVLDLASGRQEKRLACGPGYAEALALSPDERLLAAGGRWGIVGRWEWPRGQLLDASAGPRGPLQGVVCESEESFLTWERGGLLRRWQKSREVGLWQVIAREEGVLAARRDGRLLALAGGEEVHLWDATQRQEVGRWPLGPGEQVTALAFGGPKEHLLLAGAATGKLWLWDTNQRRVVQSFTLGGPVQAVALAPAGDLAAAGGLEELVVWRVDNGQELCRVRRLPAVAALTFHPTGKLLVGGLFDGSLRLWDPATGKETLLEELHRSAVLAVAFSPSGRLLATASADHTVGLWELASGRPITSWAGHSGPVRCLAWCPQGRRVLSGSDDGTALLWDVTGLGPSPTVDLSAELSLWDDLASEDIRRAYRAVWVLVAAGKAGLELVSKNIYFTDPQKLEKLIRDLDDDHFPVRERATRELQAFGRWIQGRLERELEHPASPEVARRIKRLLEKLAVPGAPSLRQERWRAQRVLEVLEQVGTPEAQTLLHRLATGAPEPEIRQEAQACLERLASHARSLSPTPPGTP